MIDFAAAMQTFGTDKVLHFAGSAALVVAAYLFQLRYSCCCEKQSQRRHTKDDYRLLYAAGFSLGIGLLKEFVDATNLLPWCNGDCVFDLWDLLVDLNGVTAALLLVIAVRNCCCHQQQEDVAEDAGTVASTVVSDISRGKEDELDLEDQRIQDAEGDDDVGNSGDERSMAS